MRSGKNLYVDLSGLAFHSSYYTMLLPQLSVFLVLELPNGCIPNYSSLMIAWLGFLILALFIM